MKRIAVIGLGEAGRAYAGALVAAGCEVHGFDLAPQAAVPGVAVEPTVAAAVEQADGVLVLTVAAAALAVAREAAPHLRAGAVYADLTSAGPADKRRVADVLPDAVEVVDVAILGPVVALGAATPLMLAGTGAHRLAELLQSIGAPTTVVGERVGEAMEHKMLRSIVMKGIAAVVCEAVAAGRSAGHEDWIRGQIAAELSGGVSTIDRLLTGSVRHAERRAEEMRAVAEFCESIGAPVDMSVGARRSLLRLVAQEG